ncbi:TetR family transcriptional regulator C-terminal domain-containing protein [Rhodococcus sp. NPDC047139]|uniref:TetR/AcrR family transcriptional regulator n=1 Tax=Rhodococcus sp. NPDC047139 TaxID=3155141 RepID=UPI00340CAB14
MPKLIDHDTRQQEISEAVWRLILRGGVGAVSIREVAAEAGLSTGSVRHVFASKSALLGYSMRLVHERAAARAASHVDLTDVRKSALAILCEFLPLDDLRRCEMLVNLALIAEAPGHPELGVIAADAQIALREGCANILRGLSGSGLVAAGLDLGVEAARLHALVDGLAMHVLVGGGDTPESAVAVLEAHIDSLA